MTNRLVLASANRGKLAELRQILELLGIGLHSLADYPELPAIEENGQTFRENALIKARAVTQYTGEIALADDSGLEVDCLEGRPGVYSARYAGEPPDDRRNNDKLLKEMAGVPDYQRTARFRCVIAVVFPDGREFTADGTLEGRITLEPTGGGGFGYDPLFYELTTGRTLAEIPAEVKNRISHRARALAEVKEVLARVLGSEEHEPNRAHWGNQ